MSVQKYVVVNEVAYVRLPRELVIETGVAADISGRSRMTASFVFVHEEEWNDKIQPSLARNGHKLHLSHHPLRYDAHNFEDATAPYSIEWVVAPRVAIGDEIAGAKIVDLIDPSELQDGTGESAKVGALAVLETGDDVDYVHVEALPSFEHAVRLQLQQQSPSAI